MENLIRSIIDLAEEKFQVSEEHPNDCIGVHFYYVGTGTWSAYLERPVIEELNNVYSEKDLLDNPTNMSWTVETHFYTEDKSIEKALERLYSALSEAKMSRHSSGRLIPICGP